MIDLDTASEMWAEGSTMLQIGVYFGVSRGAVAGFISRNRIHFPPKPKPKPDKKPKVKAEPQAKPEYTEPMKTLGSSLIADEVVAPMRRKYMGAREIKQYADRLSSAYEDATGEEYQGSDIKEIYVMMDEERKIAKKRSANTVRKMFNEAFKAADTLPKPKESAQAYDQSRLPGYTLWDLDARGCKWCINDGAPLLFCGELRRKGKQYCEPHYQRAWRLQ